MSEEPKKVLVLHVEVPGFWADDLDASAAIYHEGREADEDDDLAEYRLAVVTEEWMREEVGILMVGRPGEKCMNDDFIVQAYTGRIVGAETRDRR